MQPKRLSIFGVGLLGGSLGLATKAQFPGCRVVGYSHRASTLRAALDRGAIDEAFEQPEDAVQGADFIVLCTPVGLLPELLDQIAPHVDPSSIVTDVGSTKATVVRWAERHHESMRFVGSHPMAGSEKRGVEFASADLFAQSVCILTPTERTDREALEQVEGFWRRLEMRMRRLTPEDHDRLICEASHLPHALAAALVSMQQDEVLDLVGRGFMDATRIAGGDGGLWRDIMLDNRDNLLQSIGRFRSKLDELQALLDPMRSNELREWLDRAAKRRHELLEKREL